ncbi:hypothetical protein C8Q80DRAFT_1274081 [Daedaleopsis nitida]|nr:hypothetical protein C8Q80DRAFT_1274081 [Daedaleopsis nitida]
MVKFWAAAIWSVTVACIVAVQGASLVERDSCPTNDHGSLKCETSGGSPLVADCEAAINTIPDNAYCTQENAHGSLCTTMVRVGTCKIDVCGALSSTVSPISSVTRCNTYLRTLLASCKSGSLVGGQIFPQHCSVHYVDTPIQDPGLVDKHHYRLQFSHS